MTPLIVPLALFLLTITLSYSVWCVASPFGPCWWCTPRRRDICSACHGTGLRARLGWRIVGALAEITRDARSDDTTRPFRREHDR